MIFFKVHQKADGAENKCITVSTGFIRSSARIISSWIFRGSLKTQENRDLSNEGTVSKDPIFGHFLETFFTTMNLRAVWTGEFGMVGNVHT